jgi:type II secretory pathway component GspD/PulD (secretin)
MVGVNYLIDPRVDGVTTVQTTQPVTKADALELFQAALAPIGATLVENGAKFLHLSCSERPSTKLDQPQKRRGDPLIQQPYPGLR